MSYGFLARQLAMPELKPAMTLAEAQECLATEISQDEQIFEHHGVTYLCVPVATQHFVLPVPEVWVLSTRSGCEKTRLDGARDVVRYGLKSGRIAFETPVGVGSDTDCKPSYDTLVIVAHGLANAIIASVLARHHPNAPFCVHLKKAGMAMAHWHGFLPPSQIPDRYPLHGQENPAVSCSTPQAAIYALRGKLALLGCGRAEQLKGDVHVEPHHGTNFTASSLTGLAQWILTRNGDP